MIPPLNPLPVWLSFVSFISVSMHFDRQFTIPGQDLLYVRSNISVKQQLLFQTQAIIVRTLQTIIIKIIQQMNLNEHENLFTVIFSNLCILMKKINKKFSLWNYHNIIYCCNDRPRVPECILANTYFSNSLYNIY